MYRFGYVKRFWQSRQGRPTKAIFERPGMVVIRNMVRGYDSLSDMIVAPCGFIV